MGSKGWGAEGNKCSSPPLQLTSITHDLPPTLLPTGCRSSLYTDTWN